MPEVGKAWTKTKQGNLFCDGSVLLFFFKLSFHFVISLLLVLLLVLAMIHGKRDVNNLTQTIQHMHSMKSILVDQ